jgi:hypothetical protein
MFRSLFLLGLAIALIGEVLRMYWIMPFPGSQVNDRVQAAFFLHNNLWWIRPVGLALMAFALMRLWPAAGNWERLALLLPVALFATVFYLFNFRFTADHMFLKMQDQCMSMPAVTDSTANDLMLVVEVNGDARAYPIEIIGYHHQVLDSIGGEPVLVTYCTVCRTGRAFSPKVDGVVETFRLVGMDHYNAMFEDSRTKSWWRQATGECIVGPLKGHKLAEVPSEQMTLGAFAHLHPYGGVLHPDAAFTKEYAALKDYDEGTMVSSLEGRDTASWQPKSWVVGVVHNGVARAYDWNELLRDYVVDDTLGGDTIEVLMFKGDRSVAVYKRWWPRGRFHEFLEQPEMPVPKDDRNAHEIDSLRIPSHQEFWHSWQTFHPNTTRYVPPHRP